MKKWVIHGAQGIAGGMAFLVLTGGWPNIPAGFFIGFGAASLVSLGAGEQGFQINTALTPVKAVKAAGYVLAQVAAGSCQMIKGALSREGLSSGIGKIPCAAGPDMAEHYLAANGITLTPGTITLEEEDGEYTVLGSAPLGKPLDLSGASRLQRVVAGRETG